MAGTPTARPPPPALPRPAALQGMQPPELVPGGCPQLPGMGPPGPMVFVPTGAQPPQVTA
jgi:hypothetical protein